MDRGLAVVITIVAGSIWSIAEACHVFGPGAAAPVMKSAPSSIEHVERRPEQQVAAIRDPSASAAR